MSTVGGPSLSGEQGGSLRTRTAARRAPAEAGRLAAKVAATEALVGSIPHNPLKPREYGDAARLPEAGRPMAPETPLAGASTVTQDATSAKLGDGPAAPGENADDGSLSRRRADSAGRALTTNQGVPVSQNQDSLKAGLRGPSLLEDFVLREKITHFDHERIPERVVHARGSGAHGYFECRTPLTEYTRAAPFAEAGKRTPVFVRFSTVIGERGSADTVRDVRGFAVKFYTEEGNWDLVGNNMPVFFIQDAMKFPDLVHAAKPEPHFAMPQASTAHDTLWDFISLMPESTHMTLWAMSDRAIPRSYRMMQGFGVHTFRLVNEHGEATLCKFHWSPKLGTHSLAWDEAVKIAGADPDFHRRDLWEAIEAGAPPAYELSVQLFSEAQAEQWSFDVLDATKLVPEELVPLTPVGTLVLDRNPDNFFAETEQVAFCTAHVVPGIDFTNDPLLQGRIHSYVDTQLLRLGGPNFHEIPINAPVAAVHNNQRDGVHRQAIHRGRVSYEPNSLGGGCPFQAGIQGFVSVPAPVDGDKMRGRPEKFAEHYAQATLFWRSQTPVEQAHIVRAFRFELGRVQSTAVRTRMVANLRNVDETLARAVADGLGIPLPDATPPASREPIEPEIAESPALSLMARPGDGSIRTRRVAILVADGVDGDAVAAVHAALAAEGAVPRVLAAQLGSVKSGTDEVVVVDASIETLPSVLFDAVVLPGGAGAMQTLAGNGQAVEFVRDQYRHAKTLLCMDGSQGLLAAAGVATAGEPDAGLVLAENGSAERAIAAFVEALGKHRHLERETDPPRV